MEDMKGCGVYLEYSSAEHLDCKPLQALRAARFNWTRVVGRKIIFLFDTVDQSRFFEQCLGNTCKGVQKDC